jgi:uncharacterized protein (TIGR03382 family)
MPPVDPDPDPPPGDPDDPGDPSGGCCDAAAPGATPLWIAVVAAGVLRRRRRT